MDLTHSLPAGTLRYCASGILPHELSVHTLICIPGVQPRKLATPWVLSMACVSNLDLLWRARERITTTSPLRVSLRSIWSLHAKKVRKGVINEVAIRVPKKAMVLLSIFKITWTSMSYGRRIFVASFCKPEVGRGIIFSPCFGC